MEYVDGILNLFNNFKIQQVEEETIFLLVRLMETLSVLAEDSNLFKDALEKILAFNFLPCLIAKAYMSKDQDIISILFYLTRIENFPNKKVANLLSKSSSQWMYSDTSFEDNKQRPETSSGTSKYINRQLLMDLNELIARVNRKIDNNEIKSLRNSDVIELYRQKINYLTDNLNSVNETLDKYTEISRDLKHQNTGLLKLGEKQELINWCLELDNELLLRENHKLENACIQLKQSIGTFRNKIDKEIAENVRIKKSLSVTEFEIQSKLIKK